jgi:hypothetical protein
VSPPVWRPLCFPPPPHVSSDGKRMRGESSFARAARGGVQGGDRGEHGEAEWEGDRGGGRCGCWAQAVEVEVDGCIGSVRSEEAGFSWEYALAARWGECASGLRVGGSAESRKGSAAGGAVRNTCDGGTAVNISACSQPAPPGSPHIQQYLLERLPRRVVQQQRQQGCCDGRRRRRRKPARGGLRMVLREVRLRMVLREVRWCVREVARVRPSDGG